MPSESLHCLNHGNLVVKIAVASDRLTAPFGPRFDRSAMVTGACLCGREFLHPYGLPDEFGINGVGVLGYDEASLDGAFVKIGVGRLRRNGPRPYNFATRFPVDVQFPVAVRTTATSVTTEQASEAIVGYRYEFNKTYTLLAEHALVIRYHLRNVGERAFEFEHYNHNFFQFGGAPIGPAYVVTTDLGLPDRPPLPWRQRGRAIRLVGPAPEEGGVRWGSEQSAPPGINQLTLAHHNRQAVKVAGDFPVCRFAIWAIRSAICPEVFFRHRLEPGATVSWSRTYRFMFSLPRSATTS